MNSEQKKKEMDQDFFDFETPQKGNEINGKVVQKDNKGIILSVGLKNDAWLPKDQFGEDLKSIKTGESLKVEIIKIAKEKIIVSRKKIMERESRKLLEESFQNKTPLSGKIEKVVLNKNKQQVGMMVEMKGKLLFMPRSLYEKNPPRNLDVLLGRGVKFLIKEMKEDDAIVSRIGYLEEKKKNQFNEFVSLNREGSVVKGKIKKFLSQKNKNKTFAMIINSNGLNLFLHRNEAVWGNEDLKNIFKEGQEIDVKIIKINKEKMQIDTSYNLTKENPWDNDILEKDNWLNGMILNKTKTGLFLGLENGIEGFVHETEIPQGFKEKRGEKVKARIKNIDKENKKISLSLISKEEAKKPRGETFGDKIEGGQTLSDLLKDFE